MYKSKKSRKISIGLRYGNLVRIKDFKKPHRDHDNRYDQQDSKVKPELISLSPQIDVQQDSKEKPEFSLSPRPKKKKLLILNLNGFLIRRIHILDHFRRIFVTNRIPDYRFCDTLLFKRPFSEDFMKFCLQRFEVAIWSSAMEVNVYGALTCAIGWNLVEKLLFVWDQTYCKDTGYKSMENAEKPLFLKELEMVWDHYPSYSASNTLMIECKPYRTIHNLPNTAIFIDPYDLENERDNLLDPNGVLCQYLYGVAQAEDVQEYVKENHFGLPELTPQHRDWDLFMLLSYSTYGDLVKVRDLLEEEEEEEEEEDDESSEDELQLNLPVVENMNVHVQPKKKKLLIMNLNGFLMRKIHLADWADNPSTRVPDYLYRNFLLFKRPFSTKFMRFCLERFEVGIWSSARGYNLDGALACAIGRLRNRLLFVWNQSQCFDTGYRAMECLGKRLYIKEIYNVWEAVQNGGPYSFDNTLMIDDKPYRALLNPPHTTIFTESYDIDEVEDNLLDPEGELCSYLNGVAEAEDAGHYVAANPFGLPRMSPAHPDWEYYAPFHRSYQGNGIH